MKKYLIALDLDGTLLNDESKLSDTTIKYIDKVVKDGHKVVIATGRAYSGMNMFYKELNLKTPIITCNGGMINHPHDKSFKTIYNGIDKEIIKDIFFKNDDCVIDAFFDYGKNIYRTANNERLNWLINEEEDTVFIEGKMYEILDVNPSGLIVLIKPDKHEQFENYIEKNHKQIAHRIYHKEAEGYLYELYHKDISKASALKHVLEYYNMTSKDLIAIGDGVNDIEMIEYAYVGVAMSSGKQNIIEAAKYITRCSNDEDGVIWFLDHFLGYNTMK